MNTLPKDYGVIYTPKEWRKNAFWKQKLPIKLVNENGGGNVLKKEYSFKEISESISQKYKNGDPKIYVAGVDKFNLPSNHWYWSLTVDLRSIKTIIHIAKTTKFISQHNMYEMINEIGYYWKETKWINKNFSLRQWYNNSIKTHQLYKEIKPYTRNLDNYILGKEDRLIFKNKCE